MEAAATAYQETGSPEMLEKVAARRKKLQIDALAKQAQTTFASEQWEQAADLYQQHTFLDPSNRGWKELLERARGEHRFAKTYSEEDSHASKARNRYDTRSIFKWSAGSPH